MRHRDGPAGARAAVWSRSTTTASSAAGIETYNIPSSPGARTISRPVSQAEPRTGSVAARGCGPGGDGSSVDAASAGFGVAGGSGRDVGPVARLGFAGSWVTDGIDEGAALAQPARSVMPRRQEAIRTSRRSRRR